MPRLILRRRLNEVIEIGPPERPLGRITVVEIRGESVRLLIEAPAGIPVNRLELAEAIRAEQAEKETQP